jgi:hypothetical protein
MSHPDQWNIRLSIALSEDNYLSQDERKHKIQIPQRFEVVMMPLKG